MIIIRFLNEKTTLLYVLMQVELRAFCSKHSEALDNNNTSQSGDTSVVAGSNSDSIDHLPEKSNVGCRNGDSTAVHSEVPDSNSDRSCDNESQERGFTGSKLNARLVSGCNDAQPLTEKSSEDVNNLESTNYALILKKV